MTKMPVFHLVVSNIVCAKHGLHKDPCVNDTNKEAISLRSELQQVLSQLQQGQAQHDVQ